MFRIASILLIIAAIFLQANITQAQSWLSKKQIRVSAGLTSLYSSDVRYFYGDDNASFKTIKPSLELGVLLFKWRLLDLEGLYQYKSFDVYSDIRFSTINFKPEGVPYNNLRATIHHQSLGLNAYVRLGQTKWQHRLFFGLLYRFNTIPVYKQKYQDLEPVNANNPSDTTKYRFYAYDEFKGKKSGFDFNMGYSLDIPINERLMLTNSIAFNRFFNYDDVITLRTWQQLYRNNEKYPYAGVYTEADNQKFFISYMLGVKYIFK
jgi:hypothetical protein